VLLSAKLARNIRYVEKIGFLEKSERLKDEKFIRQFRTIDRIFKNSATKNTAISVVISKVTSSLSQIFRIFLK